MAPSGMPFYRCALSPRQCESSPAIPAHGQRRVTARLGLLFCPGTNIKRLLSNVPVILFSLYLLASVHHIFPKALENRKRHGCWLTEGVLIGASQVQRLLNSEKT